jgi:hypothetical protein
MSAVCESRLNKIAAKAEREYNKKCQPKALWKFQDDMREVIREDLYKTLGNVDIFGKYNPYIILRNTEVGKKVEDLSRKREIEFKNMTVGDLIVQLSKFNKNLPVNIMCHVASLTDAGTDLGGKESHKIQTIADLDSRLEIEISKY